MEEAQEFYADGQNAAEGDRVFSHEFDGTICFGTLHKNTDFPDVSKWYISYDDGEEMAVLNLHLVFRS